MKRILIYLTVSISLINISCNNSVFDYYDILFNDCEKYVFSDPIVVSFLCGLGPYAKVEFYSDGDLCTTSDIVKYGYEGCMGLDTNKDIYMIEAGGKLEGYQKIDQNRNLSLTHLDKKEKYK